MSGCNENAFYRTGEKDGDGDRILSLGQKPVQNFDAKTSDLTNDVLTTWQVRRGRHLPRFGA